MTQMKKEKPTTVTTDQKKSQPKVGGAVALKACPTCGTKVDEAALGLRDYSSWLAGFLPGKVGGSDVDFLLEQASTGRILIHEYKPAKKSGISMGQRLLLRRLAHLPLVDVWVVWGPYEDEGQLKVTTGILDTYGKVRFKQELPRDELGEKVLEWWLDGVKEKAS